LSNVLNPFH